MARHQRCYHQYADASIPAVSPAKCGASPSSEQAVTKAAKQLGIDGQLRKINASWQGAVRPRATASVRIRPVRSCGKRWTKVPSSLDGKLAQSGQRRGNKVRGVGVSIGTHTAGSIGHDGLMTIRPDGKLYVQSGVGNLGTHSTFDLARVAADIPRRAVGEGGSDLGQHGQASSVFLPSVGSQTTHAMTRANHAGAMDAKRKLAEIAAHDLGGSP